MIKLFRVILYIAIFCVVLWFLANTQQKQQLETKFDALFSIGHLITNTHAPQPKQLEEMKQFNSCARVESDELDQKVVIYEWIDSDGKRQLSDMAPKQGYTNLKIKDLYIDNYFNLNLDSQYANLPAFVQSHIQSGVTKIYKTLVHVVKVSELNAINLKLKFFSERDHFHSYRQSVAPDTGFKTTGFYSSRLNQATILAIGSKDHITAITLHESTHAIVAAMFGGAPVWLNEGLASFFDQMIITGEQTYKFATNDEDFKLLRSSSLPPLNSHFSQSPQEWYAYANDDLNYAIDWSIVFFLMINSNRRDFLRGMLEHLAVNNCHDFSTVNYINQHYPSGMLGLESSWRNWLKTANSGTITFR